jgi:hypothetical protein
VTSAQIEMTKTVLEVLLNLATLVVLIFTCRAALKQAKAAEELTQSTRQQIEANQASAKAAKEQVEVARRQITEALRPLLTFSNGLLVGDGRAVNEGSGVALDVWWTYGKLGDRPSEHFEMGRRLAPPGGELKFKFEPEKMETKGLILVCRSLAGISSATRVSGDLMHPELEYYPDVTDWDRATWAPLGLGAKAT